MLSINPKVKKCYEKYKIKFESIDDIVRDKDYNFQVEKSCVYHIPRNYNPMDYIFAFDLDNTLTYHEKTLYVRYEDDIKLLPNRFKKLQEVFKLGYTIVVFTNQANMKSEVAIKRMTRFLKFIKLPIYVFVSIKKDNYRKPELGMWQLFLEKSNITPKKIFFCGDALGREVDFSDSDRIFAENIGIQDIFSPEDIFGSFDSSLIQKKKLELVLFVGPPGANKTTLYNEKYSDYVHVNKDTLKKREMKVFEEALQNKENIVIDNTNPTKNVRSMYIEPAKKLGYNITILYFVKAGHNYNDKREKKVPMLVYHMFFKKLEIPTEKEGKVYLVY